MLSFKSSASLFKVTRSFSKSIKKSPSVRWVPFFPKTYPYLKYLKKNNFGNNYITEINYSKLNEDFGQSTGEDFFGHDSQVDLYKLFKLSYEDLNDVEKRQSCALKKEFEFFCEAIKHRLAVGRAIHQRDIKLLKSLTGYMPTFRVWIESLLKKVDFYEYIDRLPKPESHEITFITDHEFAHYPFLAPFNYENFLQITQMLERELKYMPHNFAGVLGSIPLALTDEELKKLGIVIDSTYAGKHPFYLVNISIVITGHGVITFVPKFKASHIDIQYPIPKYVMHNGHVYMSEKFPDYLPDAGSQSIQKNEKQNALLTLESRANLFSHYTSIPIVDIEHATQRITELKVGDKTVYILPEICLEHGKAIAKGLWSEYQKLLTDKSVACFKDGAFATDESLHVLHVLIASGAPYIVAKNIIGNKVFVHDAGHKASFIFDKDGLKNKLLALSQNIDIDLAIFEPCTIEVEHTSQPENSPKP